MKSKSEFIERFLRTVLAHEYLDITWKLISDFIQPSEPYFQQFVGAAKRFVDQDAEGAGSPVR